MAGAGHRRTHRRNEGPMLLRRRHRTGRPRRAAIDPLAYAFDLVGRERGAAHRHARDSTRAGDSLDKQAGGGIAGRDGAHGAGLRVQPQPAELHFFAVTTVAGFGQHRARVLRGVRLCPQGQQQGRSTQHRQYPRNAHVPQCRTSYQIKCAPGRTRLSAPKPASTPPTRRPATSHPLGVRQTTPAPARVIEGSFFAIHS